MTPKEFLEEKGFVEFNNEPLILVVMDEYAKYMCKKTFESTVNKVIDIATCNVAEWADGSKGVNEIRDLNFEEAKPEGLL